MALDLIVRQGADGDAMAYCKRSGATDRAAINAFVRGIKALGLYDNMVCWPLRSSQNAGTGTTAYSLGGLGTYNGTLVNGPTWGVSGITFTNASSQRIGFGASQIIGGNSEYTIMGVAQLTDIPVSLLTVIGMGNVRATQIRASSNGSTQINFQGHLNSGAGISAQTTNGPTTSMFSAFTAGNATNLRLFANSGSPFNTQTADARTNPASAFRENIGAFEAVADGYVGFFNGLIAAGAMWNVALTDAQVASVLSLYKSTLGTGLSLP
jgi:hypothetical protein